MKNQKVLKKPATKTAVEMQKAEPKLPKIRIQTATGKNRAEKRLKATKKSLPASQAPRR